MALQFRREHTDFYPTDTENIHLSDHLPVGTYTAEFNPKAGFYYQAVDNLKLPPKLYGDTTDRTERIISTFLARDRSTGVLLYGEKGSGKSLLASNISTRLRADHDMSTVLVNTPFHGDSFNQFVQSASKPQCWIFDEFEKTYNSEAQQGLLTLLDGMFPSHHLFILTINNKWRVDKCLTNRPGRIFYALEYGGLSVEFIKEYTLDTLRRQEHTDSVLRVASFFKHFNFDMLKALIEEMNRYEEDAYTAVQMLNIKLEYSENASYKYHLDVPGHQCRDSRVSRTATYDGNPFNTDSINITLYTRYLSKDEAAAQVASGLFQGAAEMRTRLSKSAPKDLESLVKITTAQYAANNPPKPTRKNKAAIEAEDTDAFDIYDDFSFSASDLVEIDDERGVFTFVNEECEKLTLFRQKERMPNMRMAM